MITKKIEIEFAEGEGLNREEYKGSVIMKRLNYAEKNSLEEESTEVKVFGKIPQVKVSTARMKEISLIKSILSAEIKKTTYFEQRETKAITPRTDTYALDLNGIRNLPVELGSKLMEEFADLNSIDEKKN